MYQQLFDWKYTFFFERVVMRSHFGTSCIKKTILNYVMLQNVEQGFQLLTSVETWNVSFFFSSLFGGLKLEMLNLTVS